MPALRPTWRRVTHLADLVEIFDPDVRVCVWQRDTSPAVPAHMRALEQTGTLQALERLSTADQSHLACLPPAPGRAALIDDLSLLREILCELLGCPAVGLRLARLGYAMCPGWHVDRAGDPARMHLPGALVGNGWMTKALGVAI
jgi:hypothetical protein